MNNYTTISSAESDIDDSKYESIITTGKLGGWEFNFLTGEFWCSREYFEMLGRGTPDMPKWKQYPLQGGWLDLLHPDEVDGAQKYFASYLETLEGLYEQTLRLRNLDGTFSWILCRAQALRNKIDDKPTGLIVGTHIDITKLKNLELELESNNKAALKDNALLRSIINSPVDVNIVAIDKNYCCIAFTDAYQKYIQQKLGTTIEEGINLLNIFPDHISPILKKAFDRALTGESFQLDLELVFQGSAITYHENRYSPIVGKNGEILGLTAIIQDVTGVKETELSNRLNELRYSALFSGASDAIFIANAKTGIIEDANVKACELLGYKREELIGLHQTKLHPNSELELIKQKFAELSSNASYYSIECHALHKAGKPIPVLVTAGSSFQIGENLYSAGYFKDLSQSKEAESKIESTLELLSNAESISHTGSIDLNLITGRRIWSDEFFRILGYKPNEVSPRRELFIEHILPSERERFLKWQNEAFEKEGKSGPLELTITRKDGSERVLMISGMTYFDKENIPRKHIAVAIDITERFRMIKDLEKRNQQLLEIAWSQSHLVRAPLSRIMGLANVIKRGIVEQEQLPEFLNYILLSANELDQVIKDITNKTHQ